MQTLKQGLQVTLISSIFLLLVSCLSGPDYHQPRVKLPTQYLSPSSTIHGSKPSSNSRAKRASAPQQFAWGAPIGAYWWEEFHSHIINTLVKQGLARNPTLDAARATLLQIRETFHAQAGQTYLPTIGLTGGATRARSFAGPSNATSPTTLYNVFNAGVSVSYTLDLFGGARRALEATAAQVDYQTYELLAAYLSLTSNIVATAIDVANLNEQVAAQTILINYQQNQLRTLRKQFELGAINNTNVLSQITLVEQSLADLPTLKKQLETSKHRLSILIGQYPNETLPAIKLDALRLPRTLPLSLPAALLQQRPDIQAAAALLHVASAQIGVATANLFPQITLSGSGGWQSVIASNLFSPHYKVWSLASSLTAPLFNGGALTAEKRAAVYAYDAALANYRQTILTSFQNVADVLSAVEADAATLSAQARAEAAAAKAMQLAETQFKLGGVSYLILLNAEQQYQQARILLIQAKAARYTDTVLLYQAFGGAWWERLAKRGAQR